MKLLASLREAFVFHVPVCVAIGAMEVQWYPAVFDGMSEKFAPAALEVEAAFRVDMSQV